MDGVVNAALAEYHVPGISISIVRNGTVALTKGYGLSNVANATAMTPTTKLQIGSVTKTFTAVAVLMLVDNPSLITKAGITALDLDQPISAYVQSRGDFELPPKWASFTVRQLLSMTSGAPPASSQSLPWNEIIRHVGDHVSFAPAGSWYCYSNAGYMLLGALIQQLTGTAYPDFVQRHILSPLRMTSSFVATGTILPEEVAPGYDIDNGQITPATPRAPQSSFSSGAMVTTANDFAKWAQAMLAGNLISPASKTAMLTSATIRNGPAHFGLGWNVTEPQFGTFTKDGGLPGISAYIYVNGPKSIAVTVQANLSSVPVGRIAREVAEAYLGTTVAFPVAPPASCNPPSGTAVPCSD